MNWAHTTLFRPLPHIILTLSPPHNRYFDDGVLLIIHDIYSVMCYVVLCYAMLRGDIALAYPRYPIESAQGSVHVT